MSTAAFVRRHMTSFMGLQKYSRVFAWGIVLAFLAQIAAAILAGHAVLQAFDGWVLFIFACFLSLFVGTRLRALNNIIHECCHSSFTSNRADNVTIGKFCGAVLTSCFERYKADHLSHHAHLGDYEHDMDLKAIEKFGLHEPLTVKTLLRHVITPLLGRHLKIYSSKNLSAEDGTFFFGLKIAVLVGMAGLMIAYPMTTLVFVLVPVFYIYPTLNFWADCLDHAGLVGEQDALRASRNVLAAPVTRFLFFPRHDCYHLVHHLFPQIPARYLKDAHEKLCEDPTYSTEPHAVTPLRSQVFARLNTLDAKTVAD